MKTLIALTLVQALGVPAPVVVTEQLIGFTIYEGSVIRLEWDTNKDMVEDLRVYYNFRTGSNGAYTYAPFMYQHDSNHDGIWTNDEEFRFNNK